MCNVFVLLTLTYIFVDIRVVTNIDAHKLGFIDKNVKIYCDYTWITVIFPNISVFTYMYEPKYMCIHLYGRMLIEGLTQE